MKYWTKSILSIYKYLETMSNTLDRIILDTGKGSNSLLLQKCQTTYYQTNKMIELLDRKRKTINLKVTIEDVMGRLDRDDRRLLTLIFIDGVKSDMVAQLFGISLRTFFRKKIKALEKFTSILTQLGYNSEYFDSEYGHEIWITRIYNECSSKNLEDDISISKMLLNRVLREISNVNIAYNTYI